MVEISDPFESPKLLIADARQHISDFQREIESLRGLNRSTPKALPDGWFEILPTVSPSPTLKVAAFHILGNLRSALDHAVFASALVLTGKEGDSTKFPFGDLKRDAKGDAKRRCRDVPKPIVELLLAFKPYRRGNLVLWAMNKLRNSKSHRVLLPHVAVVNHVSSGRPTEGTEPSIQWDRRRGRFKPTLKLAPNTPAGGVTHVFRLEILIGTGAFRSEPALGVFNRMASEVERIISAIEAETSRLNRL